MVKFTEMEFTKVKMDYFSREDSRMANNHKASLCGVHRANTPIKEF